MVRKLHVHIKQSDVGQVKSIYWGNATRFRNNFDLAYFSICGRKNILFLYFYFLLLQILAQSEQRWSRSS